MKSTLHEENWKNAMTVILNFILNTINLKKAQKKGSVFCHF